MLSSTSKPTLESATLPLEQINCPICDSSHFQVLKPANYPGAMTVKDMEGHYCSSSDTKLMDQLVSCASCSLVYLNPRISKDFILRFYSSAVDTAFISQDELRVKTFEKSWKMVQSYFRKSRFKEQNVLDVGCAGGAFLAALRNLNVRGTGVEPSSYLVDYAKKSRGLDVHQGTLESQKFPNASFSAVTLWDVLEHVHDPGATLQECRRVMTDEGFLVLNFPDYGSLACRLLGFKWPFFLSVHLFYFTGATLKRLLAKNGFEVVMTTPHWQILELGYVAQRIHNEFAWFEFFSKWIKKSWFGRLPLTYNMGQTLVIARKIS